MTHLIERKKKYLAVEKKMVLRPRTDAPIKKRKKQLAFLVKILKRDCKILMESRVTVG